jgi:cyclohexanecarboxyl-CoA dehydrogenase
MGRPISQYQDQAISFALAEAKTLLQAVRLFSYKTLGMCDLDLRHTKEGARCKWWIPEITMEIVRRCLTIHGHYGYTSALPFEQRLRDILGWQIGDGTAEVSKLLIARTVMGKDAVG